MSINQNFKKVYIAWQRTARDLLDRQFLEMLKVVDDVLMEFAEKSGDVRKSTHYLEAQREIIPRKKDMFRVFHQQAQQAILAFPPKASTETVNTGAENLSLVNIDIYERNLAMHTLAERTEREHYQTLYMLSQRLSVAGGGAPLKISDVPASPKQLSQVFIQCLDLLDIENDARLLLCTLYDKFIFKNLGPLYSSFNNALIKAGILPNMKYKAAVSAAAPKIEEKPLPSTVTRITQPKVDETAEASSVSYVQALLARSRGEGKSVGSATATKAHQDELVKIVEQIGDTSVEAYPQPLSPGLPLNEERITADQLPAVKQALTGQRLELKQKVGAERLDEQHENLIDLVGMLFEQMLDDPRIPDTAKALLGHLHTPYIKIGLKEPDFLISDKHPARQFLDHAVEAMALWMNNADLQEGIYPFMKDIVFRIVRLKHQDRKHFEEYTELLDGEIGRLKEKFAVVEKHSQAAEKGKETMALAKIAARSATHKVFANEAVPKYCSEFVSQVWIDYLTLLYLREGGHKESRPWIEAIQLGTEILAVNKALLEGESVGSRIDELAERLWSQVGGVLPHKGKAIESFVRAMAGGKAPAMHIELDGGQQEMPASVAASANEALLNTLCALEPGTLFEFDVKKPTAYRARLSWYNPVSKHFLFVDSRGKKAALKDLAELADGVEKGEIAYFSDIKTSFWNRALIKIRNVLEKRLEENAA